MKPSLEGPNNPLMEIKTKNSLKKELAMPGILLILFRRIFRLERNENGEWENAAKRAFLSFPFLT